MAETPVTPSTQTPGTDRDPPKRIERKSTLTTFIPMPAPTADQNAYLASLKRPDPSPDGDTIIGRRKKKA